MIPVMLVMLVILTLLVILMMLVMESMLVMVVAKRECREAARLGTVGPEPPCWSLSHPPKLIIIAVCDINIRFNNIRFDNLSNTDTFLVFANVL